MADEARREALAYAQIPPEEEQSLIARIFTKLRLVLLLLLTVIGWELFTRIVEPPSYLLPAPHLVFTDLVEETEAVLRAFAITGIESAVGFILALALGVILAVIIARSALMEELLYPYLNIIRITPTIAIAPLLTIWFGHGLTPMIIVAALTAFFPIVVNMVLGLRSVDPDLISLMRTLNASEGQILRKIRLPNSLPYLFSSLRLAAPLAVIGALVGEFVGGADGIGRLLVSARVRIDTSMMFLMIFLAVILGIAAFAAVVAAERRLIRWHPSVELD